MDPKFSWNRSNFEWHGAKPYNYLLYVPHFGDNHNVRSDSNLTGLVEGVVLDLMDTIIPLPSIARKLFQAVPVVMRNSYRFFLDYTAFDSGIQNCNSQNF